MLQTFVAQFMFNSLFYIRRLDITCHHHYHHHQYIMNTVEQTVQTVAMIGSSKEKRNTLVVDSKENT